LFDGARSRKGPAQCRWGYNLKYNQAHSPTIQEGCTGAIAPTCTNAGAVGTLGRGPRAPTGCP